MFFLLFQFSLVILFVNANKIICFLKGEELSGCVWRDSDMKYMQVCGVIFILPSVWVSLICRHLIRAEFNEIFFWWLKKMGCPSRVLGGKKNSSHLVKSIDWVIEKQEAHSEKYRTDGDSTIYKYYCIYFGLQKM